MTSQATRRRIEGPREPKPTPAVGEMTGETLLRTYAALTHRIHEATQGISKTLGTPYARDYRVTLDSLRAQRDLIEAEVLRRMGETR